MKTRRDMLIKKVPDERGCLASHRQGGRSRGPAERLQGQDADLTAADMEAAVRTIAGSARSMGITVEGL